MLSHTSFPEITRPRIGQYGYRTYDSIFSDEKSYHDGGGCAYLGYGINPDGDGCVVLIRPDQHVAEVSSFDHCVNELGEPFDTLREYPLNAATGAFFERFMVGA